MRTHSIMGTHDFALRISLASPDQIRMWSSGEVTQPQTVHYKTLKPESDGLFSEQIFGPVTSFTCACGKYTRPQTAGFRCKKCGVEPIDRRVRRERMAHIELATPVVHPWFCKRTPNIIALLLDLSPQQLQRILFYAQYVVTAIDEPQRQQLIAQSHSHHKDDLEHQAAIGLLATLQSGDLLDPQEVFTLRNLPSSCVRMHSGAEAIQSALQKLDLSTLAGELQKQLQNHSATHRQRIAKRLQIVESLHRSQNQPEWMVLTVLPVLPPELRPLVTLDGNRFVSSDLNASYERILHRNNRIKQLQERETPEIILNNEKRLLQEAVDTLIDNNHRPQPMKGAQGRPLKSLTDAISGKRGRFRYNLLGKRVDYSGRSVIVGDPTLSLHQCGLPTSICLELFQPFLIRKMLEHHLATSPRAAKRIIEHPRLRPTLLWDLLEEVMYKKVVILNRAPTLHRLSIQAFEAKRIEGNAIHIHPLVCSAFNADFDGDQMAVHLPLSDEAQQEARTLLLSTRNLRHPANGDPSISLSQEMVLGLFYLTQDRPSSKTGGHTFADTEEAHLALRLDTIDLHTPISIRLSRYSTYCEAHNSVHLSLPPHKRITTTIGRVLLNENLPSILGFRNYPMNKDALKHLVTECLEQCGHETTAQVTDYLKQLGFQMATKSGISFAISDIEVPPEKHTLLTQADEEANRIETHYEQGMITKEERTRQLITHWTQATEQISTCLEARLHPWASLATIIKSGATKAKFQQIRQLSGMRGLIARPNGSIIEMPIRGNYLEGLNTREVFIAASGARDGFMGRSRNTANTGYLTRKLVEAGMEVWVTTHDCGTTQGLQITQEQSQHGGLQTMAPRLVGRILNQAIADFPRGHLLTKENANVIVSSGISSVSVRSVLYCQASYGICQLCYGQDLASSHIVRPGTAIGIIAGQSIGEPGTQLSMKAFHSGGIANAQGDIRRGLPRVIELFEARIPTPYAPLAPFSGAIHITQCNHTQRVRIELVSHEQQDQHHWSVTLLPDQHALVSSGQQIEKGIPVCTGTLNPHELLAFQGYEATAQYLIAEVQSVFRMTGVFLHDKHIECILRQMLRYHVIENAGDTPFIPGTLVDRFRVDTCNKAIWAQGGTTAQTCHTLIGLNKTVLQTSSWIAAASFQQTNRVLVEAALSGQIDFLHGIKERVIAGLPLPSAPMEG